MNVFRLQSEARGGACRQRLVSVRVVDFSQSPDLQDQDEVGFISPALWFNMADGDVMPVNGCTLRIKVPVLHLNKLIYTVIFNMKTVRGPLLAP